MDGTETNWDIETITSAHILFINGLKIVRGEDYTVLGSVHTYRVPFRRTCSRVIFRIHISRIRWRRRLSSLKSSKLQEYPRKPIHLHWILIGI
jgi:hypothetical protein